MKCQSKATKNERWACLLDRLKYPRNIANFWYDCLEENGGGPPMRSCRVWHFPSGTMIKTDNPLVTKSVTTSLWTTKILKIKKKNRNAFHNLLNNWKLNKPIYFDSELCVIMRNQTPMHFVKGIMYLVVS